MCLQLGLENPEGREKKVIWVDCGIHAREWIAPAFCQWFVKEVCPPRHKFYDTHIHHSRSTLTCEHLKFRFFVQIVHSHKTNKKLEQMLQNLDVYVTPVINVDGYVFTWANDSVSASLVFIILSYNTSFNSVVHLSYLCLTE